MRNQKVIYFAAFGITLCVGVASAAYYYVHLRRKNKLGKDRHRGLLIENVEDDHGNIAGDVIERIIVSPDQKHPEPKLDSEVTSDDSDIGAVHATGVRQSDVKGVSRNADQDKNGNDFFNALNSNDSATAPNQTEETATVDIDTSLSIDIFVDVDTLSSDSGEKSVFVENHLTFADSSTSSGVTEQSTKKPSVRQEISPMQVAETLMRLSKPGALNNLSYTDGCVLKYTVSFVQGKERARILETIAGAASFSINLPVLTKSGCLTALQDILKQTARDRRSYSENEKIALLHALTNVSCSDDNQKILKTSVDDLFSLSEGQEESRVGLACLCVIANLSLTSHCHPEIAEYGTRLFESLEEDDTALLKQVLTILLNLCCEPSTVHLLLTAKAPSEMSTFVARTGAVGKSTDLLIKWLRILRNLYKVIREEDITSESLSTGGSGDLDGIMYSELQRLRLHMKACVFLLCHNKESIGLASNAKLLYEYLETTN